MKLKLTSFFILISLFVKANFILIPMDYESQSNHLKAYGITYWLLEQQQKVQWLLNHRGGSFLTSYSDDLKRECTIRNVDFEVISNTEAKNLLKSIDSPSENKSAVILEKAPKIAVYTPTDKAPWDDAVTMVLTYA
ncbi:MAG: asparagine synthetase B, partial [Psychroflexus salarius]